MPIIKSAKKKVRVDKRRTGFNLITEHATEKVLSTFKKNPSVETLRKAYSAIDKAAKKHIIHKNKAANMKSRFAKMLSVKPTEKAAPTKKSPKKAAAKKKKSAS